ncbi:hypothetical protein IT570_12230 [Candidatus Sumerlaeota bacterium]|nr:hypothetical protein [Candidatus Sumerlaeota bacterium]
MESIRRNATKWVGQALLCGGLLVGASPALAGGVGFCSNYLPGIGCGSAAFCYGICAIATVGGSECTCA